MATLKRKKEILKDFSAKELRQLASSRIIKKPDVKLAKMELKRRGLRIRR